MKRITTTSAKKRTATISAMKRTKLEITQYTLSNPIKRKKRHIRPRGVKQKLKVRNSQKTNNDTKHWQKCYRAIKPGTEELKCNKV